MTAVRRLVVLGDSLTSLAVARDAARKSIETHVVGSGRGPASRTRLAAVHRLPSDAQDARGVHLLLGLASSGPAALVATSDAWLRFLARNREALSAAFARILHPGNETLAICLDKGRFSDWCRVHGLNTPPYVLGFPSSLEEGVPYPALVRPAQTLHGDRQASVPKAAEARCPEELRTILAQFSSAGVQPLISESLLQPGTMLYSIPSVRSERGAVSFAARKLRPAPDWCAVGTLVELRPCAAAESLARAALDRLEYYGIAEVEVLFSEQNNQYYLIEVNARPWIQYALAPASGHDFLGFLLEPDRPVSREPRKEGLRWIDFEGDLYVCFSRTRGLVVNGRLGLGEYLLSLMGARVYSKFDLRDPWPFLCSAWQDLAQPLLRRLRASR